jgi:hypothetical protein
MSTSAVSVNVNQQAEGYFQQRRADLSQLSQDLQSGNLSAAQQDYTTLQSLAQTGPFNGNAFAVNQRQQDFAAIGQALQNGDVSGAQQAFSQLQSTFYKGEYGGGGGVNPGSIGPVPPNGTPASPVTTGASSGSGSEIVLNLGNVTPGEQINVNINNGSNGEQVTVGVASQQGQTPEQITFNLNPNSNEQIVLNLLNNGAPSSTTSSGTQTSGVSVSA